MIPSDPMMLLQRCDATIAPKPTLTVRDWLPPTLVPDPTDFSADLSVVLPRDFPIRPPPHKTDVPEPGEELYTIELGPGDTRVVTQSQKLALKAVSPTALV